ncbi:MAG: hybrid sensor histidine kinase/response regulator transcription factor, partial [Bacteroidota bacterium]|nr:hybrid sensor histidine kinase/response regulator transcription factor [Bacteroidota bacterium]
KGNLWISTIKGIVKFDIRREKFQKFLSNIDFSQSCFFKTNNSEFMFGASDGFVVFNPNEISTNQHFPAVTITDFRLFNRSVEIGAKLNGQVVLNQSVNCTKELTLNYRNNVFTIEFAALDFSNPGENVFAYKLEGFDKNWIPTDAKNRNASYTNLNAGVYYFKVKASNNSGIWNDSPVVLKIRILPPPWKTWWAILIYILIFNCLLFVLFRYIMIQSRQRHQIELDKLEKEQLQNINQIKLQFFTNVSHEFRTPLSLIIGPVEDILSLHDVNESIRSKVEMIRHNCKKLFYLIDELMTFQKMDQGRLALKASYLDIVGFLKGIYQNFDILARRNNITMRFDTKLDNFKIWYNPNNIEKVINNLLSNAFKFTPSGGKISIEVSTYCSTSAVGQTPDFICISVVDNGKGISKQDMDHIFECFYQGNSNVKGTGVGLSLTKSLVELHKGFIRVSSDPLIETRFKVYLPIGDGHLSPEQKVLDEKNTGFKIENDASILVESSNQRDLLTENQPSDQNFDYDILVVDDNPELLDYLEMIFKDKYNVHRAVNGIEALDMIHNDEPDLVISDVMMPKMDGIELCKNIKNNLTSCHIPVILLTAKTAVEHRIEGIEVGADDYISKPFYPEFLKVRVEKLIESREKLIEKFRSDNVLIPKKVAKNPQDEIFVQKIIDIVMKNMSNEDFSVEELGISVGMSRSNLFRKLKTITGQTPIEYIYFIRLKHSMDLLLERKLNVSEIAYEVGYKNPSSFSKSFRKQYGKAPSDFLNDILGKNQ